MMGFERSDDYQPLFWVRGRPVHVTTLLVFLHLAALMVCSLLQGLPVHFLRFSSEAVLHHWAIWQPFTYAFAHLLGELNDTIWFLIEMVFLFVWGREVERYFGRKVFISLYVAMLLATPVALLTFSLVAHLPVLYAGSTILHFGLFIAFATIYPGAQFFGSIASKWVAVAILVVWSAALFSRVAYPELIVLGITSAVSFFGVRYASVGSDAFAVFGPLRDLFPRRVAPRVAQPRLKPRRAVDAPAHAGRAASASMGGVASVGRGEDVHESIDPLLDKISKHGLASLTNSERATLEKARVSLLRKERGG